MIFESYPGIDGANNDELPVLLDNYNPIGFWGC